MTELRPERVPDPTLPSLSQMTLGEVLDPRVFTDLYRLVRDEGLPYFARLDSRDEVELYLVFESIDAFTAAARDAATIEFKTYRQKLLAIIWTMDDPHNPLGFPLAFEIDKSEDRYKALRLIEQPTVTIHYLVYADEQITHLFSETTSFSAEEKARVEADIVRLFAADPEVRVESVPAASLSDEVLQERGHAYVLSYQVIVQDKGAEAAQDYVMNAVNQANLVMRRHARRAVREADYTIWVAEQGDQLIVYVTPLLTALFAEGASDSSETPEPQAITGVNEASNPFVHFLAALPECVAVKEISPLEQGAYPIMRYADGTLYHLELDEQTTKRLASLAVRSGHAPRNPYANG